MTTKKQLIDHCKKHGIMFLDDVDCLRFDAPIGKLLSPVGWHYIDFNLRGWTRPEAYQAIMEDIADGLEDCEDGDCDHCIHEPATFDRIQELYSGERLA